MGCQPAASGMGTMSRIEDGTPQCADSAVATFQNLPLFTTFSLSGATATIGIRIGVSTVLGPGPIGGSYTCAPLGRHVLGDVHASRIRDDHDHQRDV